MRLRLDIAYDGAPFVGWARQPGLPSVQESIEAALATLLRLDSVALTVAGRTDSGVHARGQVAHADVPREAFAATPGRSDASPETASLRRLNALLRRAHGGAVVISRVSEAPDGFDARFSAIWRRYAYRISDDGAPRDPLSRSHVLWHDRTLDPEAMHRAAQQLLGEHDFLAYCKPRDGATTIRTLQRLDVRRCSRDLVKLEVQADAFCHSMVRALVGSLIAVGEGRADEAMPALRLAARTHDGMHVAPAHGLTLEEVGYPADPDLATRAALARNRRDAPC